MFDRINKVAGSEIPSSLPAKYRKGLSRQDLFNSEFAFSDEEVVRSQKRHEIAMEPKPMTIFRDYLKDGFVIFSTQVGHPQVSNPGRFAACSVILQRAILVSNPARQTIYLRSYFHSAAGPDEYVNFRPAGGLRIVHGGNEIWFPLRLTNVITEPGAYVVLDVLTPKGFDQSKLPSPLKVTKSGSMTFLGHAYRWSRVQGFLSAKEEWSDLRLPTR